MRRAFRTSASLLPSGADVMDGEEAPSACARTEMDREEPRRRAGFAEWGDREMGFRCAIFILTSPPTLERAARRAAGAAVRAARVAMASRVRMERPRCVASRGRC